MRIDQIEITNFKCFEHKTIQFSPHFNLLSGDNGTGKTATLDALAVGMGALFLELDGIRMRKIQPYDMRHVGYDVGQNVKIEPQPPTVLSYTGEVNHSGSIRWKMRLRKKWGKISTCAQPIRDQAKQLQKRVQAGDSSLILPVLSYYRPYRLLLSLLGDLSEFMKPGSRLDPYQGCLDIEGDDKNLRLWFKTMEAAAIQRQVNMGVLEGLRTAVKNCLENCEKVYYDLAQDYLLVKFTNGKTVPHTMLSDGQRTILQMVADIAYKAASLNPQLGEQAAAQTPGIVLIDELDVHLHPNWQRQIVNNLKTTFPNIQFIATSHSPFIIQSLQPGELIDLNGRDAEYADKSIEDIAEYQMGVDVPQKSQRYQEMMHTAREYYKLLAQANQVGADKIVSLKQQLDKLSAPFSDNLAYHAFLQMKREAAGLG